MLKAIMVIIAIAITGTTVAQDLSNSSALSHKITLIGNNTPPAEVRQGGDTINDATVIPTLIPYPIPPGTFSSMGSTTSYTDDYEGSCSSLSPDVVYSYTAESYLSVEVDLASSSYDTRVYIYDVNLTELACGTTSLIYSPLLGGDTYFIVIDGYSDNGSYMLNVNSIPAPFDPCWCDLNRDGVVNLTDVTIFATDYFGGAESGRSNFNGDDDVNLGDISRLAQAYGTEGCPW